MDDQAKMLLMEAHGCLSDTLWYLNMFLQERPFEHPFTKKRAREHADKAKDQLKKGRAWLNDYSTRQEQARIAGTTQLKMGNK